MIPEIRKYRAKVRARIFVRGTSGEPGKEKEPGNAKEKHEEKYYLIDPRFNIDSRAFATKLQATFNACVGTALKKSKSFFFLHGKKPKEIDWRDLPRVEFYGSRAGFTQEKQIVIGMLPIEMKHLSSEYEESLVRGKRAQTFPQTHETPGKAVLTVSLGKTEYLNIINEVNEVLRTRFSHDLESLHALGGEGWKIALTCLRMKEKPEQVKTAFHADSPAKYLLGELIARALTIKAIRKAVMRIENELEKKLGNRQYKEATRRKTQTGDSAPGQER